MQFQAPSFEHESPALIEPLRPVEGGVAGLVTLTLESLDSYDGCLTVDSLCAYSSSVLEAAAGDSDSGTGSDAGTGAGTGATFGSGSASGAVSGLGDGDAGKKAPAAGEGSIDESVLEAAVLADAQLPTGPASEPDERTSTLWPGLSNLRSVLSFVLHPFPMLATNISGKALYAPMSLFSSCVSFVLIAFMAFGPVNVTGAQFMYISRFPTLLNHVQASTAFPGGRFSGTGNPYLSGSSVVELEPIFPATFLAGHPPSIECITLNTEFAVGAVSYVIETWHDPPPCVAPPIKESSCLDPKGIMLLAPSVSYPNLHGKSDPSSFKGPLSEAYLDASKGTGVFIIM